MEPMKRQQHQCGSAPYQTDDGKTMYEWHCSCGQKSSGHSSNGMCLQQITKHCEEWEAYYAMLDKQQVIPPELQCGYCGKEIEEGTGKPPVVMSFHDDKRYHMNCYNRRWPNG